MFSFLLFLFAFDLYATIKRFGCVYHYFMSEAVYLIPEFLCNPGQVDDCIVQIFENLYCDQPACPL